MYYNFIKSKVRCSESMQENNETVSIKELTELIADKDFIALQKDISKFTPFDVLKLKSHEIRHSNVLAWLFNPYESHKLDNEFLRLFLYLLSQNTDSDEQVKTINEALVRFYKNSNYQITVRRESESKGKKRVDLKIKCSINRKVDLIILIENKIYAKQGKDQLKDYLEHERIENPLALILPVFLTLDEDDTPDDKRYYHITYDLIVNILETIILVAEKNNAEIDAINFIKYYKKSLEELLGMNTETQNLAKELYKKYKTAIDYIAANGESCITIAGNAFIDSELSKSEKLSAIKDRGNSVFFPFTDSILSSSTDGDKKDWRNGAICGYFFQLFKKENTDDLSGKLHLKIEVGPFESSDKREKFLEILSNRNIEYKKGSSGNSKYTRLSYNKAMYKKTISDITDYEEVSKEMEKLFKSSKELRKLLHECVEEYNSL